MTFGRRRTRPFGFPHLEKLEGLGPAIEEGGHEGWSSATGELIDKSRTVNVGLRKAGVER